MRYKKILFCIPPITENLRNPFTGIGYLSTYLLNCGISNDLIDMNLGYNLSDLFKKIKSYNPDLIGIFLMTHNYNNSYKIVNNITKKFNLPIVLGGPHVSTLRSEVLEQCLADFAIKLEGEYTLKELMMGGKLENIDGLIYRNGYKIIENKDRRFIENLDEIPFPTYDKFELDKYKGNSIPIISSRGCPYNCIFCPVEAAIGRQFRCRSPESIIAEIDYWYSKGYRVFEFMDDNFNLIRSRVIKICKLIKERNYGNIILNCPNGIRADTVDREILQLMKDVGFKSIAFGVESGNNKILKNLKKGETIEAIENAIEGACDVGLDVTLFFVIGSPGETKADIEDSIRLAQKYPIADVFFYSMIPYPKTELYDWVNKNNYFVKNPNAYLSDASANQSDVFFATPEFPVEDRKKMLEYSKVIKNNILKKSIARRSFKNRFLGKIVAEISCTNFAKKHILNQKIFWKLYNKYIIKRSNVTLQKRSD